MLTVQAAMEFFATLACAIFAGAAVYINAVEHPARMSCGVALAAAEWEPSYKRATVMQAPLAVLGSAFACLAALFFQRMQTGTMVFSVRRGQA